MTPYDRLREKANVAAAKGKRTDWVRTEDLVAVLDENLALWNDNVDLIARLERYERPMVVDDRQGRLV